VIPELTRLALRDGFCKIGSPYHDIEAFLVSVYPLFASLPPQLLATLRAFGSNPTAPGFLLVDNCPIDEQLPPPPSDGRRSDMKFTFVSEACLLGLAQLLGEPLGYHAEKGGEIIQNVCPVESEAKQTSSESSAIPLGFHTDFDFDENNPANPYNVTNADFILLLCLFGDPGNEAYTLYADARDLCARLDREQVKILRRPLFQFQTSYSFAQLPGAQRNWCSPVPILKGSERAPEISIDLLCGVRGVTTDANLALRAVEKLCWSEDIAQRVCLQSGQALLINNRKGAHARTAFHIWPGGCNRWLQRVYVRHSLWELRKEIDYAPRVF
jgi:L-asparagine oxygenase